MDRPRYSMSFTSGALLSRESVLVAELYAQQRDWDAVRAAVLADNLLQMRTRNSSLRIYSELNSRLRSLDETQLAFLVEASRRDQNYLLWLAVCKRYRFIYDFAVEVVHQKFLRLVPEVTAHDFEIFFDNKAEWHEEVARVTPATRARGRGFIFQMMREADLLTAANQIVPALLSTPLVKVIADVDPADLTVFPAHLPAMKEPRT